MLALTKNHYDYWLKANDYYEIINKDLDRLEKLEKAIDILKETLHLKVGFYDNDFDYKFVVKVADLFECISSEEYELLKEVLGND